MVDRLLEDALRLLDLPLRRHFGGVLEERAAPLAGGVGQPEPAELVVRAALDAQLVDLLRLEVVPAVVGGPRQLERGLGSLVILAGVAAPGERRQRDGRRPENRGLP